MIEVTAKAAAAATKNRKIGVVATRATIRSRAYPKAIRKILPEAEVYTRACPELVPLIEAGHLQKDDPEIVRILNRYLPVLVNKGIDTLVLGCTHYPLIQATVAGMYPQLTLVSSSDAQAEAVLANLPSGQEFTGGHHLYLVSSDPSFFAEKARVFMPDAKKIELFTE